MSASIESGYAEIISDISRLSRKTWYIPHHPVLNPKKPDKVRIVYDCAAVSHQRSLNDFLMKGPDLTNPLVAALLRFRRWRIPVIADIEAMFYQVRVAPADRDALRFFWWPGGDLKAEPRVYRMTVHLFGAKSSPSCATFCLRETAREFGKHFDPIVMETVLKPFYVDDCLTGAETEEAAVKLIQDLRSLLAMGGFKLTKWLSSNTHVMETVPDEEKSKAINKSMPSSSTQQRVLGISWDVAEDEFIFKISVPDSPPTKRGILAVTNSLYDPLGLVMPVVLLARILYSEVCRKNLDWDEPITGSFLKRWLCWLRGLEDLQNVRIPRCYQLKLAWRPDSISLFFRCFKHRNGYRLLRSHDLGKFDTMWPRYQQSSHMWYRKEYHSKIRSGSGARLHQTVSRGEARARVSGMSSLFLDRLYHCFTQPSRQLQKILFISSQSLATDFGSQQSL